MSHRLLFSLIASFAWAVMTDIFMWCKSAIYTHLVREGSSLFMDTIIRHVRKMKSLVNREIQQRSEKMDEILRTAAIYSRHTCVSPAWSTLLNLVHECAITLTSFREARLRRRGSCDTPDNTGFILPTLLQPTTQGIFCATQDCGHR